MLLLSSNPVSLSCYKVNSQKSKKTNNPGVGASRRLGRLNTVKSVCGLSTCVPDNLKGWKKQQLNSWNKAIDKIQGWLVLSDLHVSDDSIETTLEVLRFVKENATKSKLGVLFLGDFWHGRGNYPVVPLHETLQEIKTWNFPTLMLVGNHDQKDQEGLTNLLEPFGQVNPKVCIINQPTKYLDALFFPYRHSQKELEEAIAEAGPVKAIFPHMGVKGALINSSSQSFEGVDAELFPKDVPIYCGHYHKPHVVEGTNITYVGSPYQVSLSESGQEKSLIVLDKETYQILDRIKLDFGCRHHKIVGVPKLKELLQKDLRKGDRMKITLTKQETQQEDCKNFIAVLEQKGVDYEISTLMEELTPRVEDFESLGTRGILQTYASSQWDLSEQKFKDAMIEAQKILDELENQSKSGQRKAVDVQFESVTLEGYGSFKEQCTYPINNRSIIALIGDNQVDQKFSDSNGSGKSQLSWSILWALTGQSVNCFNINNPKKHQIVNDYCKRACVRVKGTINGQSFVVERTVSKATTSSNSLTFCLNGTNQTANDQKVTQSLINQEFSMDLLQSMIYHNFKSISELIAANDRDMKERISGIVGLDVWENAFTDVKKHIKTKEKEIQALCASKAQLSQTLLTTKQHYENKKQIVQEWDENQEVLISQAEDKKQIIICKINQVYHDLQLLKSGIQQWIQLESEKERPERVLVDPSLFFQNEEAGYSENQEKKILLNIDRNEGKLHKIQQDIEVLQQKSVEQKNQLLETEKLLKEQEKPKQFAEEAFQEANGVYKAAVVRMNNFKNKNSHNFKSEQVESSFECPTCFQRVTQNQFEHTLVHLQQQCEQLLQQLNQFRNKLDGEKILYQNALLNVENAIAQFQETQHQTSQLFEAQIQIQQQQQKLYQQKENVQQRQQILEQRMKVRQDVLDKEYEREMQFFNERIANKKQRVLYVDKTCLKLEKKIGEELFLSSRDQDVQDGNKNFALIEETEVDNKCEEGLDYLNQFVNQHDQLQYLIEEENPHVKHLEEMRELFLEQEAQHKQLEDELKKCNYNLEVYYEIKEAFGPQGIQNFIIDKAVSDLNESTQEILSTLMSTFRVHVNPVNDSRQGKSTYEKITKNVYYSTQDQKEFLRGAPSDGEQRRMAAALTLGFVKLIRERYNTKCNLIILDEILANIDNRGCMNTLRMIKQLEWNATVIIVTQKKSIVESSLDAGQVDTVVKTKNGSTVLLGSSSSLPPNQNLGIGE